ncbi:lysostaphin resistance A-like protein [Promineifilum sp.]|uniref:CPBP family intramembrane glutamic endopeptidase n=1 Tax=Promineifilum sp. TaxID=2664178 RepID=UPI0035B041F9
MNIPLQLIVFGGIALLYVIYRRLRGDPWREALSKVGLRGSPAVYYLWALGVVVIIAALSALVFRFIPADLLNDPQIAQSAYTGLALTAANVARVFLIEALTVALGEELFFRGLLGGALMRRFGFVIGNLIQSLLFLLPHLFLLTASARLGLLLPVQWLAGWLQGWLFWRSKSMLPGWLAHTLINTLSAMGQMAG